MESWTVLYCYCVTAVLNIGRITTTQCPDTDSQLRLWSDSETWTLQGLPVNIVLFHSIISESKTQFKFKSLLDTSQYVFQFI